MTVQADMYFHGRVLACPLCTRSRILYPELRHKGKQEEREDSSKIVLL